MSTNKYLDRVFEEFKMYWPAYVSDIVDYYLYDDDQLVVELNTGEKVLFDPIEKTIRFIRDVEVDEKRWRYEFSQRLRIKMRAKGITQSNLCNTTGLSQPTISHYMMGKSVPSLYTAKKIADTLSCSVDDLLRFPK